jgi:hypothetical protein
MLTNKLFFDNFIVVFTILGAVLGYEFKDHIVILSTSFIGSYLTVRSLSIIFGGFPNEFEINTRIKNRSILDLGYLFYFYLFMIVALFIFGVAYQNKRRSSKLAMMLENDDPRMLLLKADEKLRDHQLI